MKIILHASSRSAVKEFIHDVVTTSSGKLFHVVITATVEKPAREAFVAVGLTQVKG